MKLSKRFGITVVLLFGALAVSGSSGLADSKAPRPPPFGSIAGRIGNWIGTDDTPLPDRIVASLGSTSYVTRTYRDGTQEMSLFVAFYANQRAGESMHSPEVLACRAAAGRC